MAKILIVDDDSDAGQLVRDHLARHGHACTLHSSGKDVLDAIQEEKHNLLILDVMLPQMSGFEICRRIRRNPEMCALPILILSAMNNEEEVAHGLAQGADDFVSKPYDVSNLVQRVESLLRAGQSGSGTDEVTMLPGAEATKRELQRRISAGESFAVAHCELLNVREFGRNHGAENRNKAIRHMGKALAQCGRELTKDEYFVGHMGGGHFIVMMSVKFMRAYCPWVRKVWVAHRDKLYPNENVGRKQTSRTAEPERLLDTLFCVTQHELGDATSSKQLFETLSQIRSMALGSHEGGVFWDRRGSAPDSAE